MKTIYSELTPAHNRQRSFYRKAMMLRTGDSVTLESYGTPVVRVNESAGTVELLSAWDVSPTTLKHVKEFLIQHGFIGSDDNKKQIAEKFS